MHLLNYFRQQNNFKTLIFTIIIAVFITACGSSSASNSGESKGKKEDAEAKGETQIQVSTTKAVSRQIPAVIQSTGSLVADEISDVAPKVAGKVTNIYANVGDFVQMGNQIAKIDDKDARLRLVEAQASVNQAIAAVRQAEARLGLSPNGTFNSSTIPEVRAANANVEQLQAELRQTDVAIRQAEVNLRQAEVNEKRYRDLVESGDAAMIVYEQYRAARDTAASALASARTSRDSVNARINNAKQQLEAVINSAKQNNQAIKSAQANVEASRAQVATAQQAVADTIVRAPFSGFVSERQTAVGEFVSSSTPILKLMRTNPIKIQLKVTEADLPQVIVGRGISIEVAAFKDRRFGGVVTAVNPALDVDSRSATVEAEIENTGNLLRSGMFGTARITREGASEGIFVAKSAILYDQATQNYRAFVIQEGVAKLRVLKLGIEENEETQVLEGLAAGEVVANSNLPQLFEGAKVVF